MLLSNIISDQNIHDWQEAVKKFALLNKPSGNIASKILADHIEFCKLIKIVSDGFKDNDIVQYTLGVHELTKEAINAKRELLLGIHLASDDNFPKPNKADIDMINEIHRKVREALNIGH